MPVRGTSHARLMRKVILREGDIGGKVFCAWDDCDNDGYIMFHVAINAARPGFPRQLERYVFCSERHRQYFLNVHRDRGLHGYLPAGERGRII